MVILNIMSYLFGPASIFNPIYLLSAIAISALWLAVNKKKSYRQILTIFLNCTNWRATSVILDLKLTFLNFIVFRPFVLAIEGSIFLGTYLFIKNLFIKNQLNYAAAPIVEGILVTLVTMLAIDLASYLAHRILHSKWLWKIHAVHHSANQLTPLTTYRQHPLELFLLYSARGFAEGFSLGLLHFIFSQQTAVITYFGLGAGFLIYMFTVNLHHAPIPVQYPKFLTNFLISPHHHHIHHSLAPAHNHTNFGVIFSIWDQMFGTFCNEDIELESLKFGTSEPSSNNSLVLLLIKPFKATNRLHH